MNNTLFFVDGFFPDIDARGGYTYNYMSLFEDHSTSSTVDQIKSTTTNLLTLPGRGGAYLAPP